MEVLCGHSVSSKHKCPHNGKKKSKNNKDIDHLVFSQLPFLRGLVKKVLVLEPRPYGCCSGARPLNIYNVSIHPHPYLPSIFIT